MPHDDIDAILNDVKRISALLEDDLTARERQRLESQREDLRSDARTLAAQKRHPASIEAEIEMLEARELEINEMLIGKGYAEKWMKQSIQDPGAYSHNINKDIADDHAAELNDIRRRLDELKPLVAPADESSPS